MNSYLIVTILVIITSVLLTLVILVQNSKGGGLASNFSSSNQFMGVRKTTDFLEKTTWTLSIILLALSLFSIFAIPRKTNPKAQEDTELRKQINESKTQTVPMKDYQAPPKEKK